MVLQTGSKEKAGSGLFGGFLNIFKSKGKNEMILPDDKKPSVRRSIFIPYVLICCPLVLCKPTVVAERSEYLPSSR